MEERSQGFGPRDRRKNGRGLISAVCVTVISQQSMEMGERKATNELLFLGRLEISEPEILRCVQIVVNTIPQSSTKIADIRQREQILNTYQVIFYSNGIADTGQPRRI